MSAPNLFDAETRQRMADLYGKPIKPAAPSMASYRAQLQVWCEMADKRHTPEELAAARAALNVPADCAQPDLSLRHHA